MEYDDVLTRNEDQELAVRVVSTTEQATVVNPNDVYTRDTEGNLAVRVVGAGGGDSHNKGFFATVQALQEAYPTAEDGDYAVVGATDTVWLWDSDSGESGAWVDSDTKGQVTSVNGQTGAVTLGINDVAPTQTGKSGYVLGTDGFVAGWVKPEIVQRSALPQASEEEVGKIYQYVGTTDANYTNGYFYKCVSDGQNPATYSWSQVDVQPAADPLPSQTGQTGKFLTTNGTDASWSDKPLVNKTTDNTSLSILGADRPTSRQMVAVGVGAGANTSGYSVVIGYQSRSRSTSGIAIGNMASVGLSASHAIQLGVTGSGVTENSDANTFKVANTNGNYEMMSADGTVPTDRFTTTPTVAGTYSATIVVDGQGNITRSWATAPDPLPSQTGNAGKVLMTNGTTASWEDVSSSPTTAPTLVAANWSNNQQTVNVSGVTATNTVIVAPFPTDAQDYASAGVLCIGQGAGTLTFSCTSVPANDLQVNVVII